MVDRSELREIFSFFDGDQNGVIDRGEFARLLGALGAGMSAEEVAIGFEMVDSDGNGLVDFDEFADWWSDR